VIVSHIGTNPRTQQQMIAGELTVELVPQGTLAERVRAGGYGLGGILTRTGLGTAVEEGKTFTRSMARPSCWKSRCAPTSRSSTPSRPITLVIWPTRSPLRTSTR
jgi:acyl CoA:acetate/3-ketoacid CoA transferase alpha subunit